MTQEEKQLLFQDLCARLPYGIKCYEDNVEYPFDIIGTTTNNKEFVFSDGYERSLEQIKPYLRPMSSMTEEEKEELSHLLPKNWSIEIDKLNNLYFDMCTTVFLEIDAIIDILNWLLSRHFDYRGLIEKGLAIKVTEENNPYK